MFLGQESYNQDIRIIYATQTTSDKRTDFVTRSTILKLYQLFVLKHVMVKDESTLLCFYCHEDIKQIYRVF